MFTEEYYGSGSIGIQLRGVANAPLRLIGNCSKLTLDIAEESKSLPNYQGGGGSIAKVSRIKGVEAKITADSLSRENLALALRGNVSSNLSTDVITGEAHAGIAEGSLILTARLPDLTQPLVVKLGAVVIVEAGNYERKRSGIYILPGASALADGDDITIDYTPLADDLVQALTETGKEYRLVFDGMNESRGGKPVLLICHRAQFSPTKSLDLIADGFGHLQIEAELLADEGIAGTGKSRYFTVRKAL